MIEFNGSRLLMDPFYTGNPMATDVKIDKLNPDYILITHAHIDHVNDVEIIAKSSGATLISNYEIVTYYEERGIKGHPMNHGGKFSFPFGTVKYVNAVHSSMFHDRSNGGNPGGFVIWSEEECIYLSGDTALTMDMKLIPMTCPKLDVAVFPIGDNFTMGYEDACIASDFVECNTIIGCHYDTFPPIKLDKEAALTLYSEQGKKLLLPAINETIEI